MRILLVIGTGTRYNTNICIGLVKVPYHVRSFILVIADIFCCFKKMFEKKYIGSYFFFTCVSLITAFIRLFR